jgi:hypothetical protein
MAIAIARNQRDFNLNFNSTEILLSRRDIKLMLNLLRKGRGDRNVNVPYNRQDDPYDPYDVSFQ